MLNDCRYENVVVFLFFFTVLHNVSKKMKNLSVSFRNNERGVYILENIYILYQIDFLLNIQFAGLRTYLYYKVQLLV